MHACGTCYSDSVTPCYAVSPGGRFLPSSRTTTSSFIFHELRHVLPLLASLHNLSLYTACCVPLPPLSTPCLHAYTHPLCAQNALRKLACYKCKTTDKWHRTQLLLHHKPLTFDSSRWSAEDYPPYRTHNPIPLIQWVNGPVRTTIVDYILSLHIVWWPIHYGSYTMSETNLKWIDMPGFNMLLRLWYSTLCICTHDTKL